MLLLSRKNYVLHLLSGFVIGLFILPVLLEWLGFSFSVADLIVLILGEPNTVNRIIVLSFLLLFLIFIVRGFFKQYNKLS